MGLVRLYTLQDSTTEHFKTHNIRTNGIPITPVGKIRRAVVALLGQWNQMAWNYMSPESIAAHQLI
jgi:hypothetical protein